MSPEPRTAELRRGSPFAADVRSIAIVRALFLGDLLMTTPAWRALRRRFPRAEITLIGLPWAEEFAARVPQLIDRFVPFAGYPGLLEQPYDPEGTAAFLAEQRAYGYDLAVQMHGDGTNSNALVAELGARATVGLARPGDTRLDVSRPYRDDENEVQRWLGLAAALGAPAGDARLELGITPHDEAWADALLGFASGGPRVGLHLGAKDPARRWPASRFAALGNALQRQGATVVLTGGPHERLLTVEAASLLDAPALNLSGQTDLGSFAAVVRRLDLLVTNDTGASHVAAAMGTPSVVLFGPTRPTQYGPLDARRHLAVDALELAPAGCDGGEALAQLPVRPVLAAAEAQLARYVPATLAERAVGGEGAACAA